MKKTWFAWLLAIVMLASVLVLPAAPRAEGEEAEGLKKLVVLNTLVKDMETVKGEETRFNAYWLPSYKIGEIFEKNLWFVPEANEIVTVVAYTDGYTDDGTEEDERHGPVHGLNPERPRVRPVHPRGWLGEREGALRRDRDGSRRFL